MSVADSVEKIRQWRASPLQFVREVFHVEPDPWQVLVLEAFPHQPRIALKACKGPGKTCVLAWLCWNFLVTRPRVNIGAISITGDQLKTGLWKEMSKWLGKSAMLQHSFAMTTERIFLKTDPLNHFMAAKSWSQSADKEEQAKALAGFHEDFIMFVLDESGGMPDAVMASAEAALSSCKEGHILQAGNPTNLEGPLYRASTMDRQSQRNPGGWWVLEITADPDDPNRTPRVSVEWARKQIETYGRDNPWVKINVFGEFPSASLNALIGPDEVREAMRRVYTPRDLVHHPRVIGVDVAREGDDASSIIVRQGPQLYKPITHRNISSVQGAGVVARVWQASNADGCFVDASGGYGWGWIDQLRQLNRAPIPVQFAGQAHKPQRYYNKRAEMYFDAVEWIKEGGALPDIPELMAALTQTTYTFKGDRMLLEPKEDVKAKLGYSPDATDAFVLTFAEPVASLRQPVGRGRHTADYDPYAGLGEPRARHETEYNPYHM